MHCMYDLAFRQCKLVGLELVALGCSALTAPSASFMHAYLAQFRSGDLRKVTITRKSSNSFGGRCKFAEARNRSLCINRVYRQFLQKMRKQLYN